MSHCTHNRITAFPTGDGLESRLVNTVCPDPSLFRLALAPEPRRANLRTLRFMSYENRRATRAAPVLFGLFIVGQLAVLWTCVWYFFNPTWNAQLAAGPPAILATWLLCSLALCFGEYFFHRYILHIETVRFLRSLYNSHLRHHKLTSITFDERTGRVRSAYPIADIAHDDQSTFPPWALIPFFAFFTPFMAPAAFSFPDVPILLGGYGAIAVAHFFYETIHVVHHQPFEPYWRRRLDQPVLGRVWRRLYGFHLGHHAYYKCNLNVAGFFGIPLADIVFGTYKQPEPLLVDGAEAGRDAARRLIASPRWPISWLDRVVFKRRRWMARLP